MVKTKTPAAKKPKKDPNATPVKRGMRPLKIGDQELEYHFRKDVVDAIEIEGQLLPVSEFFGDKYYKPTEGKPVVLTAAQISKIDKAVKVQGHPLQPVPAVAAAKDSLESTIDREWRLEAKLPSKGLVPPYPTTETEVKDWDKAIALLEQVAALKLPKADKKLLEGFNSDKKPTGLLDRLKRGKRLYEVKSKIQAQETKKAVDKATAKA